jgi:superfamily I DNA and/or RNA helicase
MAVIAPYTRQAYLIKELLPEELKASVATVDSFQGGEREVVILSMTRSNERKSVGFLSDARRLNVSVTRAKRQLLIIGDSETLSVDPVLDSLVDYSAQVGIVIPLEDLLDESALNLRDPAPAERAPKVHYWKGYA